MVAEMEREQIKDRMGRGKRARAERGAIIPGPIPMYGYKWADEKRTAYIPDEETAPIVRRMFQEVADGSTLYALAMRLTADGIPTPTQYLASKGILPSNRRISDHWGRSTVHTLLTNPAYKGEHAAYRWTHKKGMSGARAIDDPARIPLPPAVCPPLVDVALWELVQKQFERNREQALRITKQPESAPLRGYVVCGHCGNPMHVQRHRKRNRIYYVCLRRPFPSPGFATICEHPARIIAQELDAAVFSTIAEIAKHPDAVRAAAEQAREIASEQRLEIQDRVNTLEKLIERDIAKRANLLLSLEEVETDARSALTSRINELSRQIKAAQEERETLQRALNTEGDAALIARGLLMAHMDIADAPYDYKRQLLHGLGVVVAVYASGHELAGQRWRLVFKWTGLNEQIMSRPSKYPV